MSWLAGGSRTAIGLDVGRRHVKAAQFRRAGGAWRLEAAAAIPRSSAAPAIDRAETRRLREALAGGGFRGRQIVLAVPADKLMTGILELPPRESGAPIDVLARGEMARMHRCPAGTFEMVCWGLPPPARAANATFMMGAACSHADADALLDVFEDEGFDVRRLEVHVQAAARACRPMLEGVTGIAGLLDVGWSAARLVLLYRDTVVYERKLAHSGLANLAEAVAKERSLELAAVERMLAAGEMSPRADGGPAGSAAAQADAVSAYLTALVEEMRIPMSYLSSQYPDATLQRLLLTGGGGRLKAMKDHLAAALETQVGVALPSDLAECQSSVDEEYGPTLALAFGLGQSEEG